MIEPQLTAPPPPLQLFGLEICSAAALVETEAAHTHAHHPSAQAAGTVRACMCMRACVRACMCVRACVLACVCVSGGWAGGVCVCVCVRAGGTCSSTSRKSESSYTNRIAESAETRVPCVVQHVCGACCNTRVRRVLQHSAAARLAQQAAVPQPHVTGAGCTASTPAPDTQPCGLGSHRR